MPRLLAVARDRDKAEEPPPPEEPMKPEDK